jgi:hypothetical protein
MQGRAVAAPWWNRGELIGGVLALLLQSAVSIANPVTAYEGLARH